MKHLLVASIAAGLLASTAANAAPFGLSVSVPEPSTLALLGAGVCALWLVRIGYRRRRGLS